VTAVLVMPFRGSGILAGDPLYLAALQGTDPRTHALPGDFGQETRDCLEDLGRVLNDTYMHYSDVVSVQICLDDLEPKLAMRAFARCN